MLYKKPIYPRLGQNEKVYIKNRVYRSEIWNTQEGIVYELWDDANRTCFTRTVEQVSEAIKEKKIRRI